MPARHLAALTGMRFFAALFVIVLHYFHLGAGAEGVESGQRPVRTFLIDWLPALRMGGLAVDFFFVLSGFVLAHVYLDAFHSGRFSYLGFLRKRVARLYPLHLATLGFMVALWTAGNAAGLRNESSDKHFFIEAMPTQLFMVHAWGFHAVNTFNGPSWSISAEWFAYLCFPLVLMAVSGMRPWAALTVALGWFASVYWGVEQCPELLGEKELTRRAADFGVLRIVSEFPLGVALLMVFRQLTSSEAGPGRLARTALFWTVLFWTCLGITFVLCHFGGPRPAAVLLLAAAILSAAVSEQAGGLRWLGSRALVYGGEISYSMYMTHMCLFVPLGSVLKRAGIDHNSPTFDAIALTLIPVVCVVSHLTYRYIERPGQAWLAGRRKPTTAPTKSVSDTGDGRRQAGTQVPTVS